MSLEQYNDYICNNIIDELEDNKYFIMIYKPNINKKEKEEIIKKFKKLHFPFDDERDYKEDVIRIFGKDFVKQNKNNCKIIYNNKKYKLKEYLHEIDNNYNHNINEIKLKLTGINKIIDFSDMFHGCIHLLSVSESNNDIQQCISIDIFNDNNTNSSLYEEQESDNINELNDLYFDYEFSNSLDFYYGSIISSFENISSISKEGNNYNSGNSDNKMDFIQVSSTNKNKIKYMGGMFSGCLSLISIPDISKWDTSNVNNMSRLFQGCNSLISLPDITKWITINPNMFDENFNCLNIIQN